MPLVRRALLTAAVAVPLTFLVAGPAHAHVCATPRLIDVGTPDDAVMGVGAEEKPVVAVEVAVPQGFVVEEIDPPTGWTGESAGRTVRFEGGEIAPLACQSFTLRGTAAERGPLAFDLLLTHPDGSQSRYDKRAAAFDGAQLVVAGMTLDELRDAGGAAAFFEREDDGLPVGAIGVGIALVAAAALLVVGRRRASATTPNGRRRP